MPNTSDKQDKQLAASALAKLRAGGSPNAREAAALKRIEKKREAELRAEYYASIAKKDWQAWSGRQQKVLNEQARRYEIPIGNATIDLPAVVKWLHDFLAMHAHAIRDSESAVTKAEFDAAKLKKMKLENEAKQLKNQELAAKMFPREEVYTGFAILAREIRELGERLERNLPGEAGREAGRMFQEKLDDLDALFNSHFAHDRPAT